MGVFDTFITTGRLNLQSKELDGNLNVYRLGDVVPNYEGEKGSYYLIASCDEGGIVIVNNKYIDFVIKDSMESLESLVLRVSGLLTEYLRDDSFLRSRMSELVELEKNGR